MIEIQYDSLQYSPTNANLLLQRFTQATVPYNISSLLPQWILIAQLELQRFLTLTNNDVSSAILSYSGNLIVVYVDKLIVVNGDGSTGTSPSDDHWSLNISYTLFNDQIPNLLDIAFLPNGTIDLTSTSKTDLDRASLIFLPAEVVPANVLNFWMKLNWIYVSLFWTILYDLGQIVPSVFPPQENGDVSLPSTNNIFINASLFDIYSSVLVNDILPDLIDLNYSLMDFSPINNTNHLQPVGTIFWQSYSCVQRTRKQYLRLVIVLIATDISFMLFGYHFVMLLAQTYEKRRNEWGKVLYRQTLNFSQLLRRVHWPYQAPFFR